MTSPLLHDIIQTDEHDCRYIMSVKIDPPSEVDLLVAGAGPAGMAAALVASLEGLDVLLCEKSDQVGGTGSTSAGTLWIPGNSQSRAAGYSDSAEQADRYLSALIGEGTNRELRNAYLQTGPAVIDYLCARSDVQFIPCGKHPDYRSNMPGAALAGRAIVPEPFDGRLLDGEFRRIRPPVPEFMVLGGMMVGKADISPLIGRFRSIANFAYSAKLFLRYLSDRLTYARGTRLMMGNALVARLFYSLRKRNVPILFDASIIEVDGDRHGVKGAQLKIGDRKTLVKARKGVVLATGGYAQNKGFRETFMPRPVPTYSMSSSDNKGDGVEIGVRLGAVLTPEQSTSGLWTPVSIVPRSDGTKGLFPHLVLDRAKPGMIAVNSAGRRFVNEAVSYHDFVLAMFERNKTTPTIPAWLICDSAFLGKYGLGVIYPGYRNPAKFVDNGYLVSAPDLGELAEKAGIDAEQLRNTVTRYNGLAETGIDIDFGKGETELNRFNGDANHKPNPCVGPLIEPPFYALAVWPADIAVSTGLATDADARVLGHDGKPIPGLYACGNDMASVMAGSYPGPGTTLGPAIVFAYRAAIHAKGSLP
jgi:succinate dehydrogenase/fumarate reductase flavoprotein subunit